MKLRLAASVFVAVLLPLLIAGCGGEHKQARVHVPSPPPISQSHPQAIPAAPEPAPEKKESARKEVQRKEEGKVEVKEEGQEKDMLSVPPGARPVFIETGLASWYGAPYHNRPSSNGKIYDMNAMTAAHRTLPLGSIVRVTNLKTEHSTVVRITDRGPFVEGRILDLSLAAARKVDVWQAGVARVRMEVLQTPTPLNTGGRWAVQIGAFDEESSARALAQGLSRRYHTAKVLCFSSPIGAWWVRVRVRDDDRTRAEQVAHDTETPQGSIFLVRLD